MGNGAQEDVMIVGTYHLKIRTVLHAPTIQCNLLSILALVELSFSFPFEKNNLSVYLGKTAYGHGSLKNNFYMLDLNSDLYVSSDIYVAFFFFFD